MDRRAKGRSGPLLSTQYASLLDEADWALVRTLPRNMGQAAPGCLGALANHPRLFNAKGQKLQLAVSALLQLVQSGRA